MRDRMRARRGFSLVELSIVLVILGLLVGGVLSGQSLIHAAELRSLTSEFQRYVAATQTFRDKYFALPGDMTNATSFWGRADTGAFSGQCAAPATDVAVSTGTCNGNGNGQVNTSCLNGCCDVTCNNERYRYWQQLARAGLVEGSYDGIAASPTSRYSTISWYVTSYGNYAGNAFQFAMDYGNNRIEAFSTTGGGPSLKPEDLWNIDKKLDDGMPGQGNVTTQFWSLCTTAANNADLTATYQLTSSALMCSFIYRNAF